MFYIDYITKLIYGNRSFLTQPVQLMYAFFDTTFLHDFFKSWTDEAMFILNILWVKVLLESCVIS